MLKILLIISIVINIVLYFWWIDVWQYRNYIDHSIELTKKIANSDEVQEMKTETTNLGKQIINNAQK